MKNYTWVSLPDPPDYIVVETRERQVKLLIDYLTFLLRKRHIRMKKVLMYYRKRLEEGKLLKFRHFQQLIPFIIRDSEYSNPDELVEDFVSILEEFKRVPIYIDRPVSLEEFFIE